MSLPVYIYVAVASEDSAACNDLKKHLARLLNDGRIRIYDRHTVSAGDNLERALDHYLTQAHIVILLRTKHFDGDKRCQKDEDWASHLYERGIRIIQIIVGEHHWERTRGFTTNLVVLPRSGRAILSMSNPDEAWKEVAIGIYDAVKSINAVAHSRGYGAPTPAPVQYHPHSPTPQISPVPYPSPQVAAMPSVTPQKKSSSLPLRWIVGFAVVGVGAYIIYPSNAPNAPEKLTGMQNAPAPNTCSSPCCGGANCMLDAESMRKICPDPAVPCCASGRKCIPMACTDKLASNQRYNMRLAHAIVDGKEPSMSAQICFRRIASTEAEQCVPYSSAHANSQNSLATPPQPVPIVLGDLLSGNGVEIKIREQWQLWPMAQFTASHDNIKATALCMGLRLAVSNNPNTRVLVFLDDP